MRRLHGLLVALLLTIGGACSSNDTTSSTGTTAAASSTTASTPAPSSTTTTVAAPERYGVGEQTIELVDASRPTAADPGRGFPERADRTLPVLLLYPADETPNPLPQVEVADGAFPLIVFSHGHTARGDTYTGRLRQWVSAGYVVAAPTYPLTSGPGAGIGDYVNQPRDVLFVIDELLAAAEDADNPLFGHLDGQVAVAGHSLGAATTIGVAFNSCCHDERIDAAIEIAGIELPITDGTFDERPVVPLLAVHGALDETLAVDHTEALLERTAAPTYYLRFPDGGHSDILGGPSGDLLDAAVIAFLDRYLKDEGTRLEALPGVVEQSGLATLIVRES